VNRHLIRSTLNLIFTIKPPKELNFLMPKGSLGHRFFFHREQCVRGLFYGSHRAKHPHAVSPIHSLVEQKKKKKKNRKASDWQSTTA